MMHVGDELLFFGGTSLAVQATLYAYSTITHKWRVVTLGPAVPPVARSQHTTVYDPLTGHMLIVGGRDAQNRALLSAHEIAVKSVGF
jgi:hypothetical protein